MTLFTKKKRAGGDDDDTKKREGASGAMPMGGDYDKDDELDLERVGDDVSSEEKTV